MARPKKSTVDYFPHDTSHGSTMQILESRWGNDGYSFWFKLLELLGNHDNHYIDCRKPAEWEFLTAKTRLDDETAGSILQMLAKLEAIDSLLWMGHRVIFCPNFLSRIEDAYRKRKDSFPTPEKVYSILNIVLCEFPAEETPINRVNDAGSTERERERERESKGKEKSTSSESDEVAPEQKAKRMMINDFRVLFSQNFGSVMPGGCNNTAQKLCQDYTADKIGESFEIAAKHGVMTVAYVEGILKRNGKKFLLVPAISERDRILAANAESCREFAGGV